MASALLSTQPAASIYSQCGSYFKRRKHANASNSTTCKSRATSSFRLGRSKNNPRLFRGLGSGGKFSGLPTSHTAPCFHHSSHYPIAASERPSAVSCFTRLQFLPLVNSSARGSGLQESGVLSQSASLHSLSTNSMSEEARKLEELAEATPVSSDLPPIICFPGGGMFFYWMIGVVSVLQQQIDLTSAHMSGASAGALASVLAACGVDVRHAAEHAFQLSIDEKLWDRKLKLALVWGRLIRQWLWDLLPENAAELCNGRVHLFVLELPAFHTGLQFKRVPVTDFRDKADLIDCALASVHIPVFMTGHIWTEFRGSRCVDGSINADRLALNIDPRRHTLYVDPYEDPEMKERGSRFLELAGESPGPEGTWEWIEYMMNRGEEHAHKITSAGHLEPWIRKANCLEPGTLI